VFRFLLLYNVSNLKTFCLGLSIEIVFHVYVVCIPQMATQFVDGVIEFRKLYASYVQDLFDSHPLFLNALDTVSCCRNALVFLAAFKARFVSHLYVLFCHSARIFSVKTFCAIWSVVCC